MKQVLYIAYAIKLNWTEWYIKFYMCLEVFCQSHRFNHSSDVLLLALLTDPSQLSTDICNSQPHPRVHAMAPI
jgi:hypothetical protein